MVQQQLLDLFNREFEFSNFISTGNEICIANLQSCSSQYTHIYGAHLTGKTHLLKSWINLANSRHKNTIFCDAKTTNLKLRDLNLDEYRFIAVDNIDLLTPAQQIELFDLFNHIKLNNRDNYLLTSSSSHLNLSNLRVDLTTRILSGLVFALKNLNEGDLLNALSIYTKREGINIGTPELKYLLSHCPRNLGQLIDLINKSSAAALSAKKAITIPLIKQNITF